MSEEDLIKKKEGTFITGIPDFSSDPVTGFGFGIRSNIYWNGERKQPSEYEEVAFFMVT